MSVVKIGLLPGRNASFGKITENKSKLRWLAETDNILDTEALIAEVGYSQSILPIPYVTYHALYATQLCRSIDFSQDSTAPCKWEIEAVYSSEPLNQKDQTQTENPMDEPAEWDWTSQAYRKAVAKDNNGSAIVNSAGDFFDPPPEIDASHWQLNVAKNVATVPAYILEYADAINSSSFSVAGITVPQYGAKIMALNISKKQNRGEFPFYVLKYTMEFRPVELWGLSLLDQGMRHLDGGDLKQITDDSTPPRPITSPKLLDGDGGILSDPGPDTAVFLDFDVYPEKDLSVLPGLSEVE